MAGPRRGVPSVARALHQVYSHSSADASTKQAIGQRSPQSRGLPDHRRREHVRSFQSQSRRWDRYFGSHCWATEDRCPDGLSFDRLLGVEVSPGPIGSGLFLLVDSLGTVGVGGTEDGVVGPV